MDKHTIKTLILEILLLIIFIIRLKTTIRDTNDSLE